MGKRRYEGPDHVLGPRDYLFALEAEAAENAVALLHGAATDVRDRLLDESFAREVEDPTAWRNQHPIMVIYAAQLANLAGLDIDLRQYAWALDYCKQRAQLIPPCPLPASEAA